jgi:transcriptional regulator with XRE-family HTH domain
MLKDVYIAMCIGKRMRQRRKAAGLRQAALAEHLSVTHRQICRYENGRSQISAAKLVKAADLLGCPVSFFFEDLAQAAAPAPHAQDERVAERLVRLLPRASGVRLVGAGRIRGWRLKRRVQEAGALAGAGEGQDA